MKDLKQLLEERIAIIDGAMGTMIQGYKLQEADFRGERFVSHSFDLSGNNDLLVLTQPQIIEAIHTAYADAGADIIETNTFNANRISQGDYGLESLVHEINVAAAQIARRAADAATARDGKPRFVAGGFGPTTKSLSIPLDVNDPAARELTFDEMVDVFYEQVSGLMDGGVDLLLPETSIDTLVMKAQLFAIDKYFEDNGQRVPVIASNSILMPVAAPFRARQLRRFSFPSRTRRSWVSASTAAWTLERCVRMWKNCRALRRSTRTLT
jgi:5-methyltetrahydrofolate--homocysteine methyltransferase